MYDVVALGELLIDFTPCGINDRELPVYQANPGGAPCNVLSMLSRLGRKTSFIGKVGHDMFGKMLRRTLQEEGIGDSGSSHPEKSIRRWLSFRLTNTETVNFPFTVIPAPI